MAKTSAKIGKGTEFRRESAPGSGVYVVTCELKNIGGPAISRDAVEATNNDSPNDHTEFIPGIASGGDISAVANFRPDHVSQGATAGLLADAQSGTVRSWQIAWTQFPNAPTCTFDGFVTGFEITSATKDLVSASLKLKITGKPVFANLA